jgi:lysozyme family protein
MDYDTAYATLVDSRHEGAYSCDPHDPGGETYKGVARKMNPSWPGWALVDHHRGSQTFEADLEADGQLQLMVKDFYRVGYWGPACCDALPEALRYELFDFAVNTSAAGRPATAIKALQRALEVADDGVIGPATMLALTHADQSRLMRRLVVQVIRYYTGLRPEVRDRYLAGWMNRLATNLESI